MALLAAVGLLSMAHQPDAGASARPLASPYRCRIVSRAAGVTVVEVSDRAGWLATFTIGARTVQVRATARRFSEPGFGAIVDARSRVLLAPRPARLDPDGGFRPPHAWLQHALAAAPSDALDHAFACLDASYQVGADWDTYQGAVMDCSGFVRRVWHQSGLPITAGEQSPSVAGALPRKSYQQAAAPVGVFVPRPDLLQPGDLVFFDTRDDGIARATHVGIYLGTDNRGRPRFIHCTREHDGVTTYGAHLGGHYYLPRFLGARRV